MFLRKKEDILSESSQALIEEQLAESSYQREFSALLEKIGIVEDNVPLTEESFIDLLNEGKEDDIIEKFEKLRDEFDRDKENIIKRKKVETPFVILGTVLLIIGAAISAAVAVSTLVTMVGFAVGVAGFIIMIFNTVKLADRVYKFATKLKGFLPKVRNLQSRAKDSKLKNKLADLEGDIEEALYIYDQKMAVVAAI